MNRVAQLINEKNHFMEKFCALNEAQLKQLEAGQFENIDLFYNKREEIIKILSYIDAEIFKANAELKSELISAADRILIREGLSMKEAYVRKILDLDMQILTLIDMDKSEIIKELKEIRLGKKAMGGYKINAA